MSITTRDLKLRQKEVEKNLNETYSTLRKQPQGGLGAMIQKPNQTESPIKRTPVLFTSSPMESSLPYLAEWVKYRSNENAINITAHLIRQREAQKASIIYDDMKQNEIDMRNEEVSATVSRNFAPSTTELLRKYLSTEIDKQRDGERKIQEERMKRLDLQINPVRPEAPAVAPPVLRTLTAGDMGRSGVPDQAEIRRLRNEYYAKQEAMANAKEAGRQASIVAGEAKDQAVKRKFTTLSEGLIANENGRAMGTMDMIKELRAFKENQLRQNMAKYTKKSLGEEALRLQPIGINRPIVPVQVKKKGEVIRTDMRQASDAEMLQGGFLTKESLIRAKAKDASFLIPAIVEEGIKTFGESKKAQIGSKLRFGEDYKREIAVREGRREPRARGGGGGGGGGGGAVVGDLRADVMGRLTKGVI